MMDTLTFLENLTKEQLLGLIDFIVVCLRDKEVTVNVQPAPQPYTWTLPNPYANVPYTPPSTTGSGGGTSYGYGGDMNVYNEASAQGPVTSEQ